MFYAQRLSARVVYMLPILIIDMRRATRAMITRARDILFSMLYRAFSLRDMPMLERLFFAAAYA